jgi:hypothetical protein
MTMSCSIIFIAAAVYLLMLSVSSAVQKDANFEMVARHLILSLEILGFLIVTAMLVTYKRSFVASLYTDMSIIVSLSALINVIMFVSNNLFFPIHLYDYRLVASFGMPEAYGSSAVSLTYTLFFIGAVSTLVSTNISPLRRGIVTACGFILLAAILHTQTRSALVGTVAGLVVIAVYCRGGIRLIIGALVVGACAAIVLIPITRDELLLREGDIRLEIWANYLTWAGQRPLLGYGGLGNLHVFLKTGWHVYHPHNIILSAQIRGGAIAMAAMLVLISGGLYWGHAYWRQTGNIAPVAVIVAMASAGMFDYDLVTTYLSWPWVTFWLPFGILIGAERVARANQDVDCLTYHVGAGAPPAVHFSTGSN